MRILMYRWKAYNYRDIEQTFRMMGHSVDNIRQPLGNYDIDPEFEKKIEQLLIQGGYDSIYGELFCTDFQCMREIRCEIRILDL